MSRPDQPGRPVASGPVLALDVGASRIRAAAVLPDGRLVAREDGSTPGRDGPTALVEACIAHLRSVADGLRSADGGGAVGVGISAPGPLDPRTGILIDPPNIGPGIRDVALAGPVVASLGLPVAMERDTNVAALAEQAYGSARGARHFLYLTVSTGIGGAIMADGEPYGGADGLAGEIGHLPVALDAPPCGCGGAGHLEATSSGAGIAAQAAAAIAAGRAPGLAELAARRGEALDARAVVGAEAAGDPEAAGIMDVARRSFAAAIVGLVNVFNPELIVVGGGLAQAEGDRLLEPARRALARGAFRRQRQRVRIVPAALGDDVGLVGAQPLLAMADRSTG